MTILNLVLIIFLIISTTAFTYTYSWAKKERDLVRKLTKRTVIESKHWNPETHLSPVGIPITILRGDKEVEVVRENWLVERGDAPTYKAEETGETITGKYKWRYT